MLLRIRDLLYGAAILSALGIVYTSLGTLNGRLAGGFTVQNLPWAASVAIFAASAAGCGVLKIVLLRRRRRQKLLRMHPSGQGWVRTDDPVD